jgi:hypothetical protein
LDPTNEEQIREISDVRWCSIEQAVGLIRPYNVEKRTALEIAARRLAAKFGTPKAEK